MQYETKARLQVLFTLLSLAALSWYLSVGTPDRFLLASPIGVLLAFVLSQYLVAAWVYWDAKRRDRDDASEWAVAMVVPILGVLVVAAYLSKRDADDG